MYNRMSDIKIKDKVKIPLAFEGQEIIAYFITFEGLSDSREHFAVLFPDVDGGFPKDNVWVRLHSECVTGDVFHSMRCDCGHQLHEAIREISKRGGYILYLRQEGRDIGFVAKMAAYALQDQGYSTYGANKKLGYAEDLRDYKVAAEMLHALDVNKIFLLSNNPEKIRQMELYGIQVVERAPTGVFCNDYNRYYLESKRNEGGHMLPDTFFSSVADVK